MNCKQGTSLIIEQMIDLLEKISDQKYSQSIELFNGSSIGQHFRHIYDFYHCLHKGIVDNRIDYGKRERDILIENDTKYATQAFNDILKQCESLSEPNAIEVVADFSSAVNCERPVVASTVGRELMYAYDHAVHHLAMIKMGLKVTCPDVQVSSNLGVAPSTVKHWQQKGEKAPTS